MQFAKRLMMILGSLVLLAAIVSLAAPKVAHAVVATLIRDVDNPARQTVVVPSCYAAQNDSNPTFYSCTLPYTVPAGQRLVLEQLELYCQLPGTTTIDNSFLQFAEGGTETSHYLFPALQVSGSGFGIYGLNQSVRYYADAGSALVIGVNTTDPSGNTHCNFQANGYLISYP
jgi:hypothetical protein